MAWCTCGKIVVTIILGTVCFSFASSSNNQSLLIGCGYILYAYAVVGIIYHLLRKCCSCCCECFTSSGGSIASAASEPLLASENRPMPYILEVDDEINYSGQYRESEAQPVRETFHQ